MYVCLFVQCMPGFLTWGSASSFEESGRGSLGRGVWTGELGERSLGRGAWGEEPGERSHYVADIKCYNVLDYRRLF